MGVKDSKPELPSFISYDDAVKRVSDSELRRIRDAFKKCAGANGASLSLEAFNSEVLCGVVPYEVAEWLYQACGGTKRGIPFKELLCGIVVLTRGNLEEKIKFLWTLYVNNQSENGMFLYKREFARALQLEFSSLHDNDPHRIPEALTGLFGQGDRVVFEQFRPWLLIRKDATVLSKWLLVDWSNIVQDVETSNFYQSLAGVTHLEEKDIIELEKCFWSLRNGASGQLDLERMTSLLCPPLPLEAIRGTFLAFDENRDGHIDFKELCCGLSAACRGPIIERLKFCFKIFDVDGDGVLNAQEVSDMVDILCNIANEDIITNSRSSSPSDTGSYSEGTEGVDSLEGDDWEGDRVVDRGQLLAALAAGRGEPPPPESAAPESTPWPYAPLTQEEVVMWGVGGTGGAALRPLLARVSAAGHVALGLRPASARQERDIVLSWLRRARSRGLAVGQFWFLVGAQWWASWLAHADDDEPTTDALWWADAGSLGSASSGRGSARAPPPGPIDNRPLIVPNHLKTQVPTLTGEGAWLRRDVPLSQPRDFTLLPEPLWRALAAWHGGPDPLPRQVIRPPNSDLELELYPMQLKLYKHVPTPPRAGAAPLGAGLYSPVPLSAARPDRQLAYTAAFSRVATVDQVSDFISTALAIPRDRLRLWALGDGGDAELLAAGGVRLADSLQGGGGRVLVEVRGVDLTWPEELTGGGRAAPPAPKAATGLHNLGNTCFMNAALQALWHTAPLQWYFTRGLQQYEVNADNALGTRGALALRFGELCKEVWSRTASSVAPLRVRWVVARHCRPLAGGGQHDAQELLAWLLDKLHEDLNRARPGTEPRPPNAPPGVGDAPSAAAAWAQHTWANNSIITELFHGQLKSQLQCLECANVSTRFDAFNMLSLPLPMESYLRFEVKVVLEDGSVPIKYGVRVNSDGDWLDFAGRLYELAGLAPERMVLAEVCGPRISRILDDFTKVTTTITGELYAYEVSADSDDDDEGDPSADSWTDSLADTGVDLTAGGEDGGEVEGDDSGADYADSWADTDGDGEQGPGCGNPGAVGGGAGGGAEVSGAAAAPSLCMPALFCFQRSASEALMGSPPSTFARARAHSGYRSTTLPKDLNELKTWRVSSSPTPSLRSLRAPRRPPSAPPPPPPKPQPPTVPDNYIIAMHRKQVRADGMAPWQRWQWVSFGVPLVLRVRKNDTGRSLHNRARRRLNRLLTARPARAPNHNHAADCDDSLGYGSPFTLRLVRACGRWCARCDWTQHCRGCALPATNTPLFVDKRGPTGMPGDDDPNSWGVCGGILGTARARGRVVLAVDWDPTALHLRYQAHKEKAVIEHGSVSRSALPLGVDLARCLRAFTRRERLDARIACGPCRGNEPATKKLQIWRLPPVLIIHLKRFQYVNNKWVKSQKVVNFPIDNFDPTPYLAAVPRETIRRLRVLAGEEVEEEYSDSEDDDVEIDHFAERSEEKPRRPRAVSTSLARSPVTDATLVDHHQHRAAPGPPLYRLTAAVTHAGRLTNGHYVTYARRDDSWLCFNDSACTAASPADIDPAGAYLLFYERVGLDAEAYLPNVADKEPPPQRQADDKCVLA